MDNRMADNSSSNSTAQRTQHTVWDFSLVSDLFGFSIGTLCNTIVLVLLLWTKMTFSAFNVYLINVLIANIYHDLPGPLLLFLMKIYPSVRDSPACCTLFLYTQLTSLTVIILSHLLITLNRLWAVVLPYSYRTRHTAKMAVCLCIIAWLYVNTLINAEIILDAVYYRKPADKMAGRCFMEGKSIHAIASAAVVLYMLVPMLTILVTFPVVWYKTRNPLLLKLNGTKISPLPGTAVEHPSSLAAVGPSIAVHRREQSSAYTIYFVLTLSAIVFWMPITVAYSMTSFMAIPNIAIVKLIQIAYFLFYVETVIDPVLLLCFHKEWKAAFRKRFRTCKLSC